MEQGWGKRRLGRRGVDGGGADVCGRVSMYRGIPVKAKKEPQAVAQVRMVVTVDVFGCFVILWLLFQDVQIALLPRFR